MGREVPAWMEEVWSEWERAGRSGKWVLNWHRGEPVDLEERGMRFKPKPVAQAGKDAPTCPKCGKTMAPRDGGTLFVCECGRKMTQAQVRG